MPLRACLDCGKLSAASRCPDHERKPWPHTKSAAARGYDHAWRKARARQLQRSPRCQCGAPAVTVDHIIPLARGGARLAAENLASMCESCHDAKTNRDNHAAHR